MSFLYLVIAGVIMGEFTVITGGGAGALYVSILTLGFNVSPVVATATSLATMFPVAAISSGLHAKSGNINFKIGWIMIGWGTIGALIGSYFSNDIPTNHYNRLIGSIIILLTVLMIIKKRQPVKLVKSVYHSNKYTFCQTSFFGIISGLLSGSVGTSGTTTIIAGLTLLGCTTFQTVGTSVFVLSGISLVGFIARATSGSVDWLLASILAGSAIVGATLGANLLKISIAKQSKSQNNQIVDALLILGNLIMGLALLFK
ncbi:sulfite exporter TauE/SafE family protein [Weissella paramesenteroides]|uniref:sulfite exporter TauE/SafE family protein n=1 Tax=Weissella paramesenteroides TaxID=1249 RepID=UPI002E7BB573|nr:sulfite exporter TauE/SafE family protein [Weissella paramesenteroides]WPQ68210.1 sulfite exporter TauE/SafE family protein [Weissella paramesenteroides]